MKVHKVGRIYASQRTETELLLTIYWREFPISRQLSVIDYNIIEKNHTASTILQRSTFSLHCKLKCYQIYVTLCILSTNSGWELENKETSIKSPIPCQK